MKVEIGEVRATGAEQIREITRLAKELEENHRKASHEEEIILCQPCRPQEETTMLEQVHPEPVVDRNSQASATDGQGCSRLVGGEDSYSSDAGVVKLANANRLDKEQ